ncbi:hypothetical protein AB8738_14445, partial [Salinicoccus roseus]
MEVEVVVRRLLALLLLSLSGLVDLVLVLEWMGWGLRWGVGLLFWGVCCLGVFWFCEICRRKEVGERVGIY